MWPPNGPYPELPMIEGDEAIETNPDQSQLVRRYTERAVSFINNNKSKPFFLYLAHNMSHVPIFASESFEGKSGKGLYVDVVQEIDWSVGQVMRALSENGTRQEHDSYIYFRRWTMARVWQSRRLCRKVEGRQRHNFRRRHPRTLHRPLAGSHQRWHNVSLYPHLCSICCRPSQRSPNRSCHLRSLMAGACCRPGREERKIFAKRSIFILATTSRPYAAGSGNFIFNILTNTW